MGSGVRWMTRCAALGLVSGVALISTTGGAWADANVYVSATGTDASGCGTSGSPCQTLGYALSVVPAGGTVYIEGTIAQTAAATVAQDVTIAGVAGTSARIEGASGDADGLLSITGGDVIVKDVVFADGRDPGNTAGGAIQDTGSGTLTVTDATFTGNTFGLTGHTGDGAAIEDLSGGALRITDSTFSDNISGYGGGAIYDGSAPMTVTGSTFSGNSSGAYAGAIWDGGGTASSFTDSTFVDNATSNGGGAVLDENRGGETFVGVTFTGDTVHYGSGQAIQDQNFFFGGPVTVAADAFGESCNQGFTPGQWNDAGYNAGVDSSCMNGGTADDPTMVAGQFASIADNGGPTQTVMPLPVNPAIGLITANTSVTIGSASVPLCPVSSDQRGTLVPAAAGTSCDAGAVQTGQKLPQTVAFTSAAPTDAVAGDVATYAPAATASSGEAVTLTIDASSTSVCALDQSTGMVSFKHAGGCVIDAVAAGQDYSTATAQQTVTVAKAETNTTVTGTAERLSATVTPVAPSDGTPSGTVSFVVRGQTVGTATLMNGIATLTHALPAGSHEVIANYEGDGDYDSSQASVTVSSASRSTGKAIWGVSVTKSIVKWCVRRGCRYPTAKLRFHLGRSTTIRLGLLAQTRGHWGEVATARLRGHSGANARRIAGRWHGQLFLARRVEILVQVRHGRSWMTARKLRLIIEHG